MPLKTFYTAEADVPENLKGAYVARNGRYELDNLSDDHPVVATKLSLEESNRTLKTQNSELSNEKTRLESSVLPAGKVAVDPEIEKLGLAAQSAGLKQTEIPLLKTENADLKNKIQTAEREQAITNAAKVAGFNEKFITLAKEKGLNFEIASEGEGDKKTDVAYVVTEKDGATVKTKADEFVKQDAFFSQFADTFASQGEQGKKWVQQESGKDKKPKDLVAQEVDAARATGRYGL